MFHMLIDNFPSASETFISRQANNLPCDIVAGRHHRKRNTNFSGKVYEVGNPTTGFQPSKLTKAYFRLLKGRRSWKANRATCTRLTELWKSNPPDAVLAAFGPNGIRASQVCPPLDIPFAIHFHGYDASALPKFDNYRKEIKHAIELCNQVIVVSKVMAEKIEELGCSPEKVQLIPCGVPVDEFPIAVHVDRQPCHFVAVGRMVAKKAPLTTIKAFAHCQRQHPNIKLTYIGTGPLFDEAKKFVADNNLSTVNLLGECSLARVKQTLADAGCFVQHSVTSPNGDTEGWPVAIAEAMASGLPVLSTNHAGIMDQIVHGTTGYRVDENDWQAMAKYFTELATNPDDRLAMGRAGRARIEKIGDSKTTIGSLRKALETIARKNLV